MELEKQNVYSQFNLQQLSSFLFFKFLKTTILVICDTLNFNIQNDQLTGSCGPFY